MSDPRPTIGKTACGQSTPHTCSVGQTHKSVSDIDNSLFCEPLLAIDALIHTA